MLFEKNNNSPMRIDVHGQANVNNGDTYKHMSDFAQEFWHLHECINVIEAFMQKIEIRLTKIEGVIND